MYPNKQVQELRKANKLNEALQVGHQALQNNPTDLWLKRAVAWVYYDLVKRAGEQINRTEGNLSAGRKKELVSEMQIYSRHYAALKLERPDMAGSNLMRVITGVGRHLGFFPGWCAWFGVQGFASEDLQPYESEKGSSPCMLSKVARELCAWRFQPENQNDANDHCIFEFIHVALDNWRESDDNKIWLKRDQAKLHLLVGNIEQARSEMKQFLKHKSRDFWVWADFAEIERAAKSGLELACLCQSLMCKAPDKFIGKVRMALARVLIEKEEYPGAIYECLQVAEVYQRESWKFPQELENLMQNSWFDPELSNPNQQALYERYAVQAKLLAYDNLREQNATFLDGFFAGKNQQLKALFAIREQGKKTLQLLADAPWSEEQQPSAGSPYSLTLGEDAKGLKVLSIQERKDGALWDSLGWVVAVIDHINPAKNTGSFFISRSSYALISKNLYEEAAKRNVGHLVRISVAYNTVKERYDAWQMQPISEMPESSDIKLCSGHLHVHENGFAFCEDVFVPPALVKSVDEKKAMEMLCVYKKKPNKIDYGWMALTIKEKQP